MVAMEEDTDTTEWINFYLFVYCFISFYICIYIYLYLPYCNYLVLFTVFIIFSPLTSKMIENNGK